MVSSVTLPLASPVTPPKTFLQKCEGELDPTVLASFERKASLWKMAEVSTVVAYAILTAGAFIATGLLAPSFVPLTGIIALIFLEPANRLRQSCSNKCKKAAERAIQLKTFQNHHQSLSGLTPAQLQEKIDQRGIYNITGMQRGCPELTTLKPLLARHMLWEGEVASQQNKVTKALDAAAKIAGKNDAEIQSEVFSLRCMALMFEKNALEAKCKNAFINAVIRRPNYSGNITDLGTFTEGTGLERAVDAANGIEGSDRFFTFRNNAVPPILYGEAKQSTVAALAQRMVTAM